jgi:cysteinyl-tRNA synthetase
VVTANQAFTAALSEDLNASEALAAVFALVTECNRAKVSKDGAAAALAAFARFEDVLGCFGREPTVKADVPAEMLDLLQQRTAAKQDKDWATADRLRDEIAAAGWKIVDTAQGARLEKA